jgi:hypothetical protein
MALSAACVPLVTTYPKIEAPAAVYFDPGCTAASGPPSIAYYPFHGIYISIDVRTSRFGLHIPSGNVVQLNGRTIEIDGAIGATPYKATFDLQAAKHVAIGSSVGPAQFFLLPDPFSSKENFGPLEGGGEGKSIRLYLYLPRQNPYLNPMVPKGLDEGTVEIPSMTINGQRYESQKLTFKRESFVGMAAVNC